jgi:hypothetical protein
MDNERLGIEEEQVIEAPETRESIIESAVSEAELQGKLDDLASTEGDLSTESLRENLGDLAEGLSDEELMAEWVKAQKGEGVEEEAQPFTLPNGLKLYGEDGKEVTDFSNLTLQQLLNDKMQWGYNALGKEQKKALTEVFRNASLGHYNEQKMQTLAQERTRAYEMYSQIKTEHENWARDRQVWLSVLTSAAQGNIEPLKQLIKAYGEAGIESSGNVGTEQQEQDFSAEGMQWVTTEANKLAEQYGANPLEIAQAIVYLANQEPAEFLTQEKLNSIVQYEIPALLEKHQYSQKNGAAQPANDEVAALKKQVAELMADKTNATTQKVRDKQKKAPPAGGGRTSSAGDSVPAFKNREQYKRWIRDEEE